MQPVRLQRIVLAAEHHADIGGVLLGGVEVGVAGDREGQMQLDVLHRHQRDLAQLVIVAQLGMIMPQQFADPRTRAHPDLRPERHKGIERAGRKHRWFADIQPAVLRKLPQIEHVIADRNAEARRQAIGREHAIRQVLDREVG
jgi:hypothetical protein